MRKMERFIQIVEERYFPNWNSHRYKVELLRDIIDPIGDFVAIIIDLGIRYNLPRDAHVTFSAIDDTGKALWVNKYEDRPLLHRDLYSNRSNTLDKVFTKLLNSNNSLSFRQGCQIVINFHIIPEYIQRDYPEYFGRK